jgi:hypothetical protein
MDDPFLDQPLIGAERIARVILEEPDGSVSDTAKTMVYGLVKRGILDVDRIGKYLFTTRRRLYASLDAAGKRAKAVEKDHESVG